MRCDLWDQKNMLKNIDADSPYIWEFMAPFFCVGCSSVRLHGTVRPASCIRVVMQPPHDRR